MVGSSRRGPDPREVVAQVGWASRDRLASEQSDRVLGRDTDAVKECGVSRPTVPKGCGIFGTRLRARPPGSCKVVRRVTYIHAARRYSCRSRVLGTGP
jgi:hypothetical protein